MHQRFYRVRTLGALASAVQAVRTTSGTTQSELAQAIGSSRPTVSRMERGLPTATDTLVAALTECGYELVVVPIGSAVTVAPTPRTGTPPTAGVSPRRG
ncbi:helix-turn-helix protein [Sanguibacter antarcticus]|uniref:Helix-turn-helix protein n=2 Tax=Sanguibacter antarcticus TaxID=372484 RepID=A0A2A9E7B7_9MICO|nr:helix-turn-helix protein [Sanguibacter antarcticus]